VGYKAESEENMSRHTRASKARPYVQHECGHYVIAKSLGFSTGKIVVTRDHAGAEITLVKTEAGCWPHARRKLFALADIAAKARNRKPTTISPIAFEAVRKMDAIFLLERSINGLSPEAGGRAPRGHRAAGE
jgi:hypothetical protein